MIVLDLSILNQKGTPMFNSDLTANRPAAGIVGRIFIATDSPYGIFRDTGSAWDQVAGSGGGGGGNTIYTANDNLTSNRIVGSGGFSLTFNPSTTFATTLTATTGSGSVSAFGVNTLSYASGFSSSNLGSVYGSIGGINFQTFAGSATFANANLAAANVSVNSVDFSAAGSTITMTQAAGLRVMAGHQSQFQYQGTNSGTITHAAISQNLGFYRPPSATGTLTITNAYGHLINDLNDYGSGFTFTNRWGIYQAGTADKNYFAGNILAGSTTDTGEKVQITGNLKVNLISNTTFTIQSGGLYLQSAFAYNNLIGFNTFYDGAFRSKTTGFLGYLQYDNGNFLLLGSNASVTAGSSGSLINYFDFNPTESTLFANRIKSDNNTYVDLNIGSASSNNSYFQKISFHSGGFSHYIVPRHNTDLNSIQNQISLYLNNSATQAGSSAPTIGNVLSNTQSAISSAFFQPTLFQIGGSITDTPVASAAVQIVNTSRGFLPPQMTNAQILAIVSPAEGLQVFNTTISHMCFYQGGAWVKINNSPM